MKEFRLNSGEKVPAIGFGTFGSDHYSPEQVSKAVEIALEAGYRLFDCAEVYGNEDLIGKVFDGAFQSGLVKREHLFITSKLWNDHHAAGSSPPRR